MIRAQVEGLLQKAYAEAGSGTFDIAVPTDEIPAVMIILKHLQVAGQFSSHSRRDAQVATGRDDCVRIYGYTG